MTYGKLGLWRTGQWYIRDEKVSFNHTLTSDSKVEVFAKDKWEKVNWMPGPGGMSGMYADEREVKEKMEARLILENVTTENRGIR